MRPSAFVKDKVIGVIKKMKNSVFLDLKSYRYANWLLLGDNIGVINISPYGFS